MLFINEHVLKLKCHTRGVETWCFEGGCCFDLVRKMQQYHLIQKLLTGMLNEICVPAT